MPRRPLSGRTTPSRHRSNHLAAVVALLVSALLLAACASQTGSGAAGTTSGPPQAASGGSSYPVTITDASGKSVTIKAAPERIALGVTYPYPVIAEMLQVLGVGDRVVGASEGTVRTAWPAFVKNLAVTGTTRMNVEATAALQPDVVVANAVDPDSRAKFEGLGIPVIKVDPTDVATLPNEYRQLGKALDAGERGERIAAYMDQKRDAVTAVSATIPDKDKPRVFLETTRPADNASTYKTYTRAHGTTALIEAAGGVNIAADLGSGNRPDVDVNAEWILAQNPDVVILSNNNGLGFRRPAIPRRLDAPGSVRREGRGEDPPGNAHRVLRPTAERFVDLCPPVSR